MAGDLFGLRWERASKAVEHLGDTMEKETCEVCGYESDLGAIESHHIVPTQVTEEAAMPRSQTVKLCCNCHREVDTWYRAKVTHMAYDPVTKQFRAKSYPEMVKEYQSAFDSFVKYKKTRKKRIKR